MVPHLEVVKVIDEFLTVPSVVSELLTEIVTSEEGWLLSLTVKIVEPPDSVVLSLIELIV